VEAPQIRLKMMYQNQITKIEQISVELNADPSSTIKNNYK